MSTCPPNHITHRFDTKICFLQGTVGCWHRGASFQVGWTADVLIGFVLFKQRCVWQSLLHLVIKQRLTSLYGLFVHRQCPSCGRSDVENCLLATAAPLDCPRYMCGAGLLQTSTAMTCIISQRCCGGSGEYDSGTYNSGAEYKSNTESQYTNDNIAKGSTNTKDVIDKIPSTGGAGGGGAAKDSTGGAGGGGAAKDTQDNKNGGGGNNAAKDDNKYESASDTNPGSEICMASKSGCYFPSMCCSGVCSFGMTSSIGMCQ